MKENNSTDWKALLKGKGKPADAAPKEHDAVPSDKPKMGRGYLRRALFGEEE